MTLDKRTREQLLAHCGELHDDDGVDPRQFFKPENQRSRKQDHKTRRLCHQVAETLALVLAGELADQRLQSLRVESVDPAPDASQLMVTLCLERPCSGLQRQETMDRLTLVTGRLRTAVAEAITRKRTPKLQFRLIDSVDPSGEDPS